MYFKNVILARNRVAPWGWSKKIETCWSNFKCFSVKRFYVCALVGVLIKRFYEMHGATMKTVIPRLKKKNSFYFPMALRPNAGHGLILGDSRSHTTTQHSRQDFSGPMIISTQKHLSDNTEHLQETYIHVPSGIRNHNFSRRAAADPRLILRG